MERLTYKELSHDGRERVIYSKCEYTNCADRCYDCHIPQEALRKLKEYEDAEEQGLLLRLPCKVGDMIWCIMEERTRCSVFDQEFDEYSCQGCEWFECDSKKIKKIYAQTVLDLQWILSNIKRFGVNVFLTREEAEEHLKEKF